MSSPLVAWMGASQVVSAASFPHFAHWRWHTLANVAKSLRPLLATLRNAWPLFMNALHKLKDRTLANKATDAMTDAAWHSQFLFVDKFSHWLTALQKWGTGCECHREDLESGLPVSCDKKSRLMHLAYDHAAKHFHAGVAAAQESWDGAELLSDATLGAEFVGMVRRAAATGLQKLGFLTTLPWLLCNLDQPGVRDQALQQWGEALPENHEPLTQFFFTGSMGVALRNMNPDGSGLPPAALAHVQRLREVPLDDSVGEGPHASANRVGSKTRAAKWGWIAGTMRLDQNLRDFHDLTESAHVCRQQLWNAWKSVLRRGLVSGRDGRNVKCNNSAFVKQMYEVIRPFTSTAGGDVLMLGDAPAEPLVDDAMVVHAGDELPPGDAHRDLPLAEKLMNEYLEAALQPYMYVSAPAKPGSPCSMIVFQVLGVRRQDILVRTFRSRGRAKLKKKPWIIQPLEVWRGAELAVDDMPSELFVYPLADPMHVQLLDYIDVTGFDYTRAKVMAWQAGESDLAGTMMLTQPAQPVPPMSLSHKAVPVLTLMDALDAAGWIGVQHQVVHAEGSAAIYDIRKPMSSRDYMQAVLSLRSLFQKGNESIASGRSQAYYRLLLRSSGPVDDSLSAAEHIQALKRDFPGEHTAQELANMEPIQRRRPTVAVLADDEEIDGGDACAGREAHHWPVAVAPVADAAPDLPPVPPPPSPHSAEEGSVDGDDDGLRWPEEICGRTLHMEMRFNTSIAGLRVSCGVHIGCNCYRSIRLAVDKYGPHAAVYC